MSDPGLAIPKYIQLQINPLLKEIEVLKQRVEELEKVQPQQPAKRSSILGRVMRCERG